MDTEDPKSDAKAKASALAPTSRESGSRGSETFRLKPDDPNVIVDRRGNKILLKLRVARVDQMNQQNQSMNRHGKAGSHGHGVGGRNLMHQMSSPTLAGDENRIRFYLKLCFDYSDVTERDHEVHVPMRVVI